GQVQVALLDELAALIVAVLVAGHARAVRGRLAVRAKAGHGGAVAAGVVLDTDDGPALPAGGRSAVAAQRAGLDPGSVRVEGDGLARPVERPQARLAVQAREGHLGQVPLLVVPARLAGEALRVQRRLVARAEEAQVGDQAARVVLALLAEDAGPVGARL